MKQTHLANGKPSAFKVKRAYGTSCERQAVRFLRGKVPAALGTLLRKVESQKCQNATELLKREHNIACQRGFLAHDAPWH